MSDQPFTGRLRVRVNGLVVRERSLLLIKIKSPTGPQPFWMPPGGGVDFGERLEDAVVREMNEEAGMKVEVGRLRYVSEYLKKPWHAVEFYFDCLPLEDGYELGSDPELADQEQMLKDLQFVPFDKLNEYNIAPQYLKDRFVRDYLENRQETVYIRAEQPDPERN